MEVHAIAWSPEGRERREVLEPARRMKRPERLTPLQRLRRPVPFDDHEVHRLGVRFAALCEAGAVGLGDCICPPHGSTTRLDRQLTRCFLVRPGTIPDTV